MDRLTNSGKQCKKEYPLSNGYSLQEVRCILVTREGCELYALLSSEEKITRRILACIEFNPKNEEVNVSEITKPDEKGEALVEKMLPEIKEKLTQK